VGVLRAIADRYPDLEVSVLTRVSAGATNAVYLASHAGSFREQVHGLSEMRSQLEVEDIFKADLLSLGRHGLRWFF
jgi:NTE family protein